MSLRTDLRAYLLAQADIRQHVGDRVYWQAGPQKTDFPYITYQLVSRPPVAVCLQGEGNLRQEIWQFDIWCDRQADPTGATIEALDRAVAAALLDRSGAIGHTTVDTINRVGGGETNQPPATADDNVLNRVMHEYEFTFES